MSGWTAKRFWKAAEVEQVEGGWIVRLDGRDIRTPGKAALIMPTKALAEAVRDEWDAQGERITPETMPVTRTVNSAIDKVAPQRDGVIDVVAAYADADLLCYRADGPAELVRRQKLAWDPLLDWAAEEFDARLHLRTGVMHQPQESVALDRLKQRVAQFTDIELAAFHDLVSLSGSLIIGLAVYHSLQPEEQLWTSSRIDELWQEEQWGEDDEASELARKRRAAFLTATEILRLARE